MNLEWIDDLLAVIDSGSLRHAAQKRFVTQPAFSRRIRAIELKMGVGFVDRTRKPVQPQPTLVALESRLREASQLLHELKRDLSTSDRDRSELVIGGQHAISTTLAPLLVQSLSEQTDIRVRLRSANREECLALLFTRQLDIALLYRLNSESTQDRESFVDSYPLGKETLVPVSSKEQHSDFKREFENGSLRIIAYPKNVFLGDVMHRKLLPRLDKSITIRWTTETALTSATLQLALAGNGVAWIPLILATSAINRGELIRLDDHLPTESMSIVAHKLTQQNKTQVKDAWSFLTTN